MVPTIASGHTWHFLLNCFQLAAFFPECIKDNICKKKWTRKILLEHERLAKTRFYQRNLPATTESHQKAQNCTKSHMSRTEGKIAGIPIFGYLIKI